MYTTRVGLHTTEHKKPALSRHRSWHNQT